MSDNLHRPYTESELDIMRDFCSREWTTDEDVRDNLHDSRWLATLAAKDAELERVRGAVRDYLEALHYGGIALRAAGYTVGE